MLRSSQERQGGIGLSIQHTTPAILHPDGQYRVKPILLPDKFRGVFDYSPNCGWHDCNDRYLICRQQESDLIDSYLLLFTVSGEGMVTAGGKTRRVLPGEAALLPRQDFHSYWTPRGKHWEFYWIHLSGPQSEAILSYIFQEYGFFFEISCLEQLAEYIELMLKTPYQYYDYELFASQTISKLLFTLMDGIGSSPSPLRQRKRLALEIIDFMESHLSEPFRLSDLSARLYLSTEHMIRLFHQETGMTPRQYVKRLRLKRACALLEAGEESIGEIAAAVGYQSPSAFIAQFKACFSITPKAYRLSLSQGIRPNSLSFQEDAHHDDHQGTL